MAANVAVMNADCTTFLSYIDWRRAMILLFENKVEVLVESDKVVRTSAGDEYKVPAIVRLIKAVRQIYKSKVPYSKKAVFIRDGYICQFCSRKLQEKGKLEDKPTVDHVMPSSRGGKSEFDNTVCSCLACNNKKGDRTPREAGMRLIKQPYQPTINEFMIKKAKQLGVYAMLEELWKTL